MALVPTALALIIGLVLGLRWGGAIDNLISWRPQLPVALVGGLTCQALVELAPLRGSFATFVSLVGMALLLWFAVLNVRTGGMVLVVAGLGLDALVTLVNWGTPVSGSALVSAGVVDEAALDTVELTAGRTLADGALLGFLGDVIPLPWGQVISIGDVVILVGIVLVTASVVRRYQVRGSARPRGSGRGMIGGPSDYRTALDALGRGPAPRRGPGLHPSRLDEHRRPQGRGAPSRPARPSRPSQQRRPAPSHRPERRRPGSGPR